MVHNSSRKDVDVSGPNMGTSLRQEKQSDPVELPKTFRTGHSQSLQNDAYLGTPGTLRPDYDSSESQLRSSM